MRIRVIWNRLGHLMAGAAGAVLAKLFAIVGRIRPAAKPIHSRGIQFLGTCERTGSDQPWGVPWLDDHGREKVLVRLSRSVGLPPGLPDVLGLALRLEHARGHGDLLFATTGAGRFSRYLLVPRRSPVAPSTVYTTLFPFETMVGPVQLRAQFLARTASTVDGSGEGDLLPLSLELFAGSATRPWSRFGTVRLTGRPVDSDPVVSFDPVLNQVPGLGSYSWARLLRQRAYAAARRSRRPSSGS